MSKVVLIISFGAFVMMFAPVARGVSFYIKNLGSKRCMDVSQGSVLDDAIVKLWDCVLESPNQFWALSDRGTSSNTAAGLSMVVDHSKKCLTVKQMRMDNNAPVIQYRCQGSSQVNQLWEFVPSNQADYFLIRNPVSNKCLTTYGGGVEMNTPLVIYDCQNTPNQKWYQRQICV